MKENTWRRSLLSVFAVPSVVVFFGTVAYAVSLDDIHKKIKEQNKHWVAGETENSLVPEYAQGKRAGTVKPKRTGHEKVLSATTPPTGLPASSDWSTGGVFYDAKNYVTPPRNQGNCGSCWAFATAGALESYTLIKGGDSACNLGGCDLSEQMLLTCSGAGNCAYGGYIDAASNYIRDTGLPSESCYAYNISGTSCSPSSYWESEVHKIDAWAYVAVTNPTADALKNALTSYGPLVTTMDIYQDFYLYYRGGVYSFTSGSYVGAHAIVIVGYQDDSTFPGGGYFRVKNSWGTNWGEAGFFRIAYSEVASVVNFGDWTIAYQTGAASSSIPAAPAGLAAATASSSQIRLSWGDNSANEDGFRIERCEGNSCTSFTQIAAVGANTTTYTNGSLTANTPYTYRVRAYNAAGNSDYSNAANAATPAPPALPSSPSSLGATAVSRSEIKLSWVDNALNEEGFQIERCTGVGCTNFTQIATLGPNVKTFSNKNLRKGTAYNYRVRAYNAGGYSVFSNAANAAPPAR